MIRHFNSFHIICFSNLGGENRRVSNSRGKESIALLYWMLAREVEATELSTKSTFSFS